MNFLVFLRLFYKTYYFGETMTQLNMRRPVAVVFIIIGVADKGTQGKCKTLAYTLLCGGINRQIKTIGPSCPCGCS